MNQNLSRLFASVVVISEFHPQARAIRFWRASQQDAPEAAVIFHQRPTRQREQLEADIAVVATMLGPAAMPDYYAFCQDIESIFNGAGPSGPISRLRDLDWHRFRQVSAYAQHWRSRNPEEVVKLLAFMMAMPLFSRIAAQLIVENSNETIVAIEQQMQENRGVYLLGVRRFHELFRSEIDTACSESKLLVATYRGSKKDNNAAQIVNRMLGSIDFS
ncbi:MAG: hypothetical protein JJU48_02365 [Methylophaga sp.]|nr:hypothetical protein [Methylophaga sp.]